MKKNLRSLRRSAAILSAVGAITVFGATACGTSSGSGGSNSGKKITLVYASFGGSFGTAEEKAWLQPFVKLHPNITIKYAQVPDFGTLAAAVETGNVPWNVTTVDLQGTPASKYFDKLDCKLVPCSQMEKEPNSSPYAQTDSNYAVALTYNKSMFKSNVPTSWADFFDPAKFPGKRVSHDTSGERINIMLAALMAAGVNPAHITPFDYQLAFKELDKIKNDMIWTQSQSGDVQAVYSGEAAMCICETDQVQPVDPSGKVLGVSWNGRIEGATAIEIVKGSANEQASQELVAYILDAQNNAKFSYYVPDGPTNTQAVSKANPKYSSWYVTSHSNSGGVAYPWPWVILNGQQVTQEFEQWKTS